jgi:hypothetical protein
MLKKSLALLILGAAFSAPSWADWDHHQGRVIRVEPVVSIGYSNGPARFQILYELGGQRYWTYADYRPGAWIAVPPPRYVYPYRWEARRHYRWNERGHDHDGWRDDRRDDGPRRHHDRY